LSLEVEKVIPGPIERVFDAWLDADTLRRWMAPAPGVAAPQVDPVVGGAFRIVMRHKGRDIVHEGRYLAIDRPHTLSFTWNSEPAGQTTVHLRFEAMAENRTRVVLTHEKFQTAAARDGHRGGWSGLLDALVRQFE
jgi:uncharacterized protein YndB with AHSA1/START domain